jgi:hypothetical protein
MIAVSVLPDSIKNPGVNFRTIFEEERKYFST